MSTSRRQLPDLQPAIDRLKALAAHSGDRLLLADGPPNPDAALLELCSEALHHLTAANKAHSGEDYQRNIRRSSQILRNTKKIPATTAAGIYAKALCVRCSRTGAAEFAMSLAEDLVNNPALRACMWPAEPAGRA